MDQSKTSWGKIVEGHVLDVNKKYFLRALKDYDNKLFIKWNPNKNNGFGLWEIWREPEQKTAVYKTDFNGHKVFELQNVYRDLVEHVLDLQHLNYEVLNRLREIDAWQNNNWVSDFEYEEGRRMDRKEDAHLAERKYQLRHHRKVFEQLREEFLSGKNPFKYFV